MAQRRRMLRLLRRTGRIRQIELIPHPGCVVGRLAQFETLFTTANGYLGIRGACEEGDPVYQNTDVAPTSRHGPIHGLVEEGLPLERVQRRQPIALHVRTCQSKRERPGGGSCFSFTLPGSDASLPCPGAVAEA